MLISLNVMQNGFIHWNLCGGGTEVHANSNPLCGHILDGDHGDNTHPPYPYYPYPLLPRHPCPPHPWTRLHLHLVTVTGMSKSLWSYVLNLDQDPFCGATGWHIYLTVCAYDFNNVGNVNTLPYRYTVNW